MSWKDRLRKASFRGISFQVADNSTDVGRRVVIHTYVNRPLPYAEDLGRKPQVYKMEAFLLGEDYDIDRNNLLRALQQEGPGELVHPNLGNINVAVIKAEVIEESTSNRIVRFSLEFHEVGEKRFPDSSPDHLSLLNSAIDGTKEITAIQFEEKFSVHGVQQFVKDDAISIFTQAVNKIAKVVSVIETAEEDAARSAVTIDKFKRDTFSLISSPGIAAQRYLEVLNVLSSSRSYKKMFSALRDFYTFGDDQSTPARRPSRSSSRLLENRIALNGFIKATAFAESARAASLASLPETENIEAENGFSSVREAVEFRRELINQIDSLLGTTTNDALYLSLVDLRNEIVNTVPGDTSRLKIVRTFINDRTVPSLVLAHKLHGDAEREKEIIVRNRLGRHGFIPAGAELEVTIDA